jgi:hypothetical protein
VHFCVLYSQTKRQIFSYGKKSGVKAPGCCIDSHQLCGSDGEWSEAQQKQRQRFREANAYAKAAMADDNVRLVYETNAGKLGRQPYRLAISDYFKGNNLLTKNGS